ncbi:protein shisa-1-like [Bufo gargarizans]|uniref:protein shisa-1-like n=1 Tax=Bufo gargarizans TaxID=30331 RepID=UPI001CF13343|nr:protein shisa-1-like [Bufo gargarizans]
MCPLLILVLLLHVSSSRAQFGEYCHGWTDNYGSWHSGFQCPERYDHVEATYCCGSCNLRYCCTASEARLDQGQCPSEEQEDILRDGAPAVEMPDAVPTYLPFLLVGTVFVSFVIVGALVGVCCCRCLRPEEETQMNGPAPQSRLLDTEPSTDVSRHSSSSSNCAPRGSLGARPQNLCALGAENINLYMNMPQGYPVMGCPPNAQFIHAGPSAAPFLQPPFINYAVPGEHAILMAPASYIDARRGYPQSTNYLPLTQHIGPEESPSKC